MTEDQLYLLVKYLEARFEMVEKDSPWRDDSKAGEALDKLLESLRQSDRNRNP